MFHWVRLRLSCPLAGVLIVRGENNRSNIIQRRVAERGRNHAQMQKTTRKRKHLPRKELEDEKVRPFPPFPLSYIHHGHPFLMRALFLYTRWKRINRLLKKSDTWNNHNPLASAEDRTPATHTGNGALAEGEVDEDDNGEAAAAAVSAAAAVAAARTVDQVIVVIPMRYRWISTLRPSPDAPHGH